MTDELRPDSAEEAVVDADELIAELRESRFGRYFVLAAIVVAAIVAASSIRYFMLCSKYHTWDPRAAVKAEKEEARKKEADERREERRKAAAEARARKADAPETKGDDGKETKSTVEKELEATSKERPVEPDVNLNKELDLE